MPAAGSGAAAVGGVADAGTAGPTVGAYLASLVDHYPPFTLETGRLSPPAPSSYDVIADPYLAKTPRAMRSKLEVLERGSDMVLANH